MDRQRLATKLFHQMQPLVEGDTTPSYLDVTRFLREQCDRQTGALVIGQFLVRALFEERHSELMFWPLVAMELAEVVPAQLEPGVVEQGLSYLNGAGVSALH